MTCTCCGMWPHEPGCGQPEPDFDELAELRSENAELWELLANQSLAHARSLGVLRARHAAEKAQTGAA